MTEQTNVILADPNPLMLQALSEIFERDRRFSLVATCKSAEAFLEASLQMPTALGVIDWELPQIGAERLLLILRDRPRAPRITVCASVGNPEIARRAMAAGAAGFFSQETPPEQLLDIVASVASGRMVFPFLDIRSVKNDPRDNLTDSEKTIIAALSRGKTNNELSQELGISVNTVKFHLRNLYDKLGLKNRSQAIAFYYSTNA